MTSYASARILASVGTVNQVSLPSPINRYIDDPRCFGLDGVRLLSPATSASDSASRYRYETR